MKVTILKRNLYQLRGKEKYALQIAEAYAAKGCHVTILTSGELFKDSYSSCGIVNLMPESVNSYSAIRRFNFECEKWVKASNPDIVLGMDYNTFQTYLFACNGVYAAYLQKSALFTTFGQKLANFFSPLQRRILSYEQKTLDSPELQAILSPSSMVRDEFLIHYKIDQKKVRVIPPGIDLNESLQDFEKWHIRRDWLKLTRNLSETAYQFLFLGNGYEKHGLKYLLAGLALLSSENFELCVIGKDNKMHQFVELAKKYKIENKVKFFGYCDNVNEFYQIADAVVIPSIYDPFSNVTLEGLAMGTFIVSSRNNGGKELLNSQSGILIEDLSNPESMAATLKTAMTHRKTMESAKRIRDRMTHYNLKTQIEKLISETVDTAETEKIARILW